MPALGRSLLASGWRRAFPPAAACMAALALGLALAVPAPAQIRLDDSDQASAARATVSVGPAHAANFEASS